VTQYKPSPALVTPFLALSRILALPSLSSRAKSLGARVIRILTATKVVTPKIPGPGNCPNGQPPHYPLFIIHYSLFIIHYSLFLILKQ
jgi:hypothetical protein